LEIHYCFIVDIVLPLEKERVINSIVKYYMITLKEISRVIKVIVYKIKQNVMK
jgi:hypothetical protein